MAQTKFEVGDWVIITNEHTKLCIVGQVAGPSNHYANGIVIENVVVRHDPTKLDDHNPNDWPLTSEALRIERLGPPDAV